MESQVIDQRLRAFVFLCVLAACLLIYTGIPDSADGTAMLAVARSMVQRASFDIAIIGAEDAQFEQNRSRMGVFGIDGEMYSKKGLTPSLALLPFVFAAQIARWLPIRASAMLLNPLITAATAVLLYQCIRACGFRPRSALLTALLFGVATTAFVYSKTLFGEPLAGLLLLAAVYAAYRYQTAPSPKHLLLAGSAIGLCIGVNLTYMVMIPAILYLAFGISRRLDRALIANALLLLAPAAIAIAGIGIYNLARFGSPMSSGYYFSEGEGFSKPFLAGVFGLTLSPYRGLLWYTPLLLLALPGWRWLQGQHGTTRLAWTIVGMVVLQIATYAAWWSWDGGITWGTRFLVPVISLLMMAIAPFVERAFEQRLLTALLIILAAFSFGIQLLGGLFSYFPYTGHLFRNYSAQAGDSYITAISDRVLFDTAASPIIGHVQMLLEGTPLEPAWLRSGLDLRYALIAIALIALALVLLRQRRLHLLLASMGCLIACNFAAACSIATDCAPIQSLEQVLQPAHPALVASTHYGTSLLDIETLDMLSMNAPTEPGDALAQAMWGASVRHDRLWYVSWFPAADPLNWQERLLWETAAFAAQHEHEGHRALYFRLSPPTADTPASCCQFGEMRLMATGIQRSSDGLSIALEWQAEAAPRGDYQWFVHVLDAAGSIIAQQDRPPQGGYAPTSGWQAEQRVTDYLFFPLTEAEVANAVTLRVGWVDPTTGELISAVSPTNGEQQAFALIPIAPR
jgi:hypothetical protein